jgi:hypothetical protein
MDFSFKQFFELHRGPTKHKPKKGNYIDGLWQELGIDRNSLPDFIESGPIEVEDEGLLYNQAIWQIIKPIEDTDLYVRIRFYQSKSPNFERAYVRHNDGQLSPYQGKCEGKTHLISIQKLANILGKGWQAATSQAGGMPGGGMPV